MLKMHSYGRNNGRHDTTGRTAGTDSRHGRQLRLYAIIETD